MWICIVLVLFILFFILLGLFDPEISLAYRVDRVDNGKEKPFSEHPWFYHFFRIDKVQFSAVAPEVFVVGQPSIVRLFIYEEDFWREVHRAIPLNEELLMETKSGLFNIYKKEKVRVILTAPDIRFYYASEERIWLGKYLQYAIPVILPKTYRKKRIHFNAKVYVDDVCRVCLAFVANCVSSHKQRMNIKRRDIHSAFISYARENTQEVLGRIQAIKKVMPDLDLFFDKDNLRSGEYWKTVLRREIKKRDILYLFWSQAASESEWVEKEWKYALKLKGLNGIDPFPLETIPPCPSPPHELKSLHFQDKWLYFQ